MKRPVKSLRKPLKPSELRRNQMLEEISGELAPGRVTGTQLGDLPVSSDLDRNLELLRRILGDSDDIVFREISIGHEQHIRAAIIFVDGIVHKETIHNHVMKSLMLLTERVQPAPPRGERLGELIRDFSITVGEVKSSTKMGDVLDGILNSDTALFIEGVPLCYIINTKAWEHRSVQEPETEAAVRGPREGFNEVLRTTTALMRRRVKDSRFRVKQMRLGRRTKTDIAVMYLEGVANERVVEEVFARLHEIDVDAIRGAGDIEQLIEDNPFSPFPQVHVTERTDKVQAGILEGRVAIAVDTTPFVLLVPATFWGFYQAPDDYFERWVISTFIRSLRLLAVFLSLILPSVYVALVSFHPEMIPARLALALARTRAGVPFPVLVEMLILEVSVETLREASVRLPGPIGPTIGIIGAIIIGEAAIRAGLAGPLAVIMVALTTIASFVSPSYSAAVAIRVLRFPLLLLASALGLVGVMMGVIAIATHLCSLDSFGVPYFAPVVPLTVQDLKDTVVRVPTWEMKKRPMFLRPLDLRRMADKTSAYESGRAQELIDIGTGGGGEEDDRGK